MIPDDIAVAATPDNMDNEVDFFTIFTQDTATGLC
jgi:hypothetical protein